MPDRVAGGKQVIHHWRSLFARVILHLGSVLSVEWFPLKPSKSRLQIVVVARPCRSHVVNLSQLTPSQPNSQRNATRLRVNPPNSHVLPCFNRTICLSSSPNSQRVRTSVPPPCAPNSNTVELNIEAVKSLREKWTRWSEL
uniref:Uncharacterized protein n=1 Tax=Panagrellus redivivus TaxID=6233 RepID=A0A7E4VEC4_PANRE